MRCEALRFATARFAAMAATVLLVGIAPDAVAASEGASSGECFTDLPNIGGGICYSREETLSYAGQFAAQFLLWGTAIKVVQRNADKKAGADKKGTRQR